VRIHASSGTAGKPTVVAYTRRDVETWTEVRPVPVILGQELVPKTWSAMLIVLVRTAG